ncbi:glycoside hydrolase, partial [Aureobasidium melanogenum]
MEQPHMLKKTLAVSGAVEVGFGEDDTLVDKVNVRPVISLGALAINGCGGVRDSSPEAATADVLAPGCVFADEVGELGGLGDEGGLPADRGSDVLGVGTSSSEVVDVRVDDEVGRGVEVRLPESSALEAVLEHDGDAAIDLCNTSKNLGGVVGNPLSTLGGETGRSSEAGEVVRGLVDWCHGPGSQVAAGLDEVKDGIDGVVGVVEVGGVVEEVIVHQSLTDIEVVDTTRERVETDNDVHAVSVDGVVGDSLEVLLLVTVVESRSGNLNPRLISSWDSEGVHSNRGKLINSRGVEEGGIAGFQGVVESQPPRLAPLALKVLQLMKPPAVKWWPSCTYQHRQSWRNHPL